MWGKHHSILCHRASCIRTYVDSARVRCVYVCVNVRPPAVIVLDRFCYVRCCTHTLSSACLCCYSTLPPTRTCTLSLIPDYRIGLFLFPFLFFLRLFALLCFALLCTALHLPWKPTLSPSLLSLCFFLVSSFPRLALPNTHVNPGLDPTVSPLMLHKSRMHTLAYITLYILAPCTLHSPHIDTWSCVWLYCPTYLTLPDIYYR